MSKRVFSGYQVRSRDLTGIILTDWDLDTCKRYCRKGDVIISTYWKKFGIDIRISWMKWYKPFQFVWNRNRHSFNILWLHVNWNYLTIEAVDKVVYENKEEEEYE